MNWVLAGILYKVFYLTLQIVEIKNPNVVNAKKKEGK